MSTQYIPTNAPGFPRSNPGAALHAFDAACVEFLASQPHRSDADWDIGKLLSMADQIVQSLRLIGVTYERLNCVSRPLSLTSVASQWVDSLCLPVEAQQLLQAAIDRRVS